MLFVKTKILHTKFWKSEDRPVVKSLTSSFPIWGMVCKRFPQCVGFPDLDSRGEIVRFDAAAILPYFADR